MIYFTVEKELVRGSLYCHEVESDGSRASDTWSVESDEVFEMTTGFTVHTYDEQGVHIDTNYYPVETNTATWQDNADEVLEQIKADYPAGEYQNNNW